jgi:hypothetical protein
MGTFTMLICPFRNQNRSDLPLFLLRHPISANQKSKR